MVREEYWNIWVKLELTSLGGYWPLVWRRRGFWGFEEGGGICGGQRDGASSWHTHASQQPFDHLFARNASINLRERDIDRSKLRIRTIVDYRLACRAAKALTRLLRNCNPYVASGDYKWRRVLGLCHHVQHSILRINVANRFVGCSRSIRSCWPHGPPVTTTI